MNQPTKGLIGIILFVLLPGVGGTIIGMELDREAVAAIEYVPQYIVVEKPQVEIVEIETVVEKVEYVKVPDYELRQFPSYGALQQWLQQNRVDDMGKYECWSEALELQRRAFRDGFQMSTQALFKGKKEPAGEYWHLVNSSIVGPTLWCFDPVTAVMWKGGHQARQATNGGGE